MSKPAWTTEPPEADGWYWWRPCAGHQAEMWEVRNGVVQIAWGRRGLLTCDAVEAVGGQWQGPLVPTEDV